MTEENIDTTSEDSIPDELTLLKQRADMLGIKYHPNSGVEKLKVKIEAKLNPSSTPATKETVKAKNKAKQKLYLTHDEFIKERSSQIRKNINRLVRIRVSCMNPNKKEWEGEIISVGSAKLGTFKKFVPFNSEEGWHVPNIIYEAMKERKYSSFTTVRGPRGEKIRKGKLVPEFNIEVLPPLTPKEIKELAQRQIMEQGTSDY
jgi:hypothetical protein